MGKQSWTAIALALVMGTTSITAMAQPGHGHGASQGRHVPKHPPVHPGAMPYQHPVPAPHARPHVQPPKHHAHGTPPGHAKRMGAGPQHNWVKGSRVPPHYRTKHYVVNDWRGHGLKRPPQGYQWVQYGSDYLLVALATGVIAQLILGH